MLHLIEVKANDQVDSPLYLAGYLLNPNILQRWEIVRNLQVMEVVVTCLEKFFPDDFEMQNEVVKVDTKI